VGPLHQKTANWLQLEKCEVFIADLYGGSALW